MALVLTATPAVATTVDTAASTVETTPVTHSGDAADDPAIWLHPADPAQSLVIGNDKGGALESYNLDGSLVQRINYGKFVGNVDVRGNYVAVSRGGIVLYTVDPVTRLLVPATDDTGVIKTYGEGLCLYDPGAPGLADGMHAFTITRKYGRVRQYALSDGDSDGLVSGRLVRDFTLGTEAEGCVADDATGWLYVAEEDVAIWRYGADPSAGTARVAVDRPGPQLPPDIEGLTIAAGHLIASAQNVAEPHRSWFNVYDLTTLALVRSVRVAAGTTSDDCDRTDGIAASAAPLGAAFPTGLFVCQDNYNSQPGTTGNQNFKFVPLERILPDTL